LQPDFMKRWGEFNFDAPPLVVSYDGGVHSTAILVGFHQRRIRPDLIMMTDPGAKKRKPMNISRSSTIGSKAWDFQQRAFPQDYVCASDWRLRFRVTLPTSPSRPTPRRSTAEGSGTGVAAVITRTESPGNEAVVFQSIRFEFPLSIVTRSPGSRPTSTGSS